MKTNLRKIDAPRLTSGKTRTQSVDTPAGLVPGQNIISVGLNLKEIIAEQAFKNQCPFESDSEASITCEQNPFDADI